MSTEQFSNLGTSRLASALTVGATTLQVVDASSFPSSPQFRLSIQNELLLVTAVAGTTFTVTRGIEGTTPAAYDVGQLVRHILTAGALQAISSGGSPGGPAGGDLSGTYPNPTVAKLQGEAVSSSSPSDGEVLIWSAGSSQWQPATPSNVPGGAAGGDLSGTYPYPTVAKLQGEAVSSSSPSDGEVLIWSAGSSQWQPATPSNVPGGAASGDLSGTYPAPIVAKLQGEAVSSSAPGSGQSLVWNAGASQWQPTTLPVFGASGSSHAQGQVPDPGSAAGSTRYLREDATWATPAGGGSGNITSTGAAGSEPGSPNSGDLYLPNNGFVVERYSGSVWSPWGPLFPLNPPSLSAFSWLNQGSATANTTNGGIVLQSDLVSPAQMRCLQVATPATPYTRTAAFLPLLFPVGVCQCGLYWYSSGDGKVTIWTLVINTTWQLIAQKWNSTSSFNSGYTLIGGFANVPTFFGPLVWMRLGDDGTNRTIWISVDGQTWVKLLSVARTDWHTPDHIGFFVASGNTSLPATMTLLHWQ